MAHRDSKIPSNRLLALLVCGAALTVIVPAANALPALIIAKTSGELTTRVNSRLYRHCHIVGSRARVVCMTADPWSPEHDELDRRQGRLHHDTWGSPGRVIRGPDNCPKAFVRSAFRSRVRFDCPGG